MNPRPRVRRLALAVAWSLGLLGLICWVAWQRPWIPGPEAPASSAGGLSGGGAETDRPPGLSGDSGSSSAASRVRGSAAPPVDLDGGAEIDGPERLVTATGSERSRAGGSGTEEGFQGAAWPSSEGEGSPVKVRVVDASTGRGLEAARVRVTAFHGGGSVLGSIGGLVDTASGVAPGFAAASGLDLATATPPLHRQDLATGSDGVFEVRRPFPEDPRVALYAEVSHRGYAPGFLIVPGARESLGSSEIAEVPLRPAPTAAYRLVDPEGRGLADAPLQVTPFVEGHDFLEAEGVHRVRRHGRLVARAAAHLLHTDSSGRLLLPVTGHEFELALAHPFYFFEDPDSGGDVDRLVECVLVRPSDDADRTEWVVRPGWPARHQLVDLEGTPVAESELEIELDGMGPRWVRTDPDGWFEIGLRPRARDESPLGYANPRRGRLTILTPELFKRQVPVALPSQSESLVVRALPADRLRFRTVVEGEEGALPIRPDGVEVSARLTLVRQGDTGEVEYVGSLPTPGDLLEVRVRGYLPQQVVVPAMGRAERILDLGDVIVRRGWEREVVVAGLSPLELRGAVLSLREVGPGGFVHVYPVGERARVTVGGLRRGDYELGVEGPWMESVVDVSAQTEAVLDEPWVLRPQRNGDEVVQVLGTVAVADPLEASRARVVERFWLRDAVDPISMPPYPLGSSGELGSRRAMGRVVAAEVVVIAEKGLMASARLGREPDAAPLFDFGVLRLRPLREAEIRFVVDELGTVAPPPLLSLVGPRGAEAISFLGSRDRRLVVENVLPGNYTLRWRGPSDRLESFGFEVEEALVGTVELTAKRAAGVSELIEVLVTDRAGRPVQDVTATPQAPALYDETLPPGVCLVEVTPHARNRFEVHSPGFLVARVDVPEGGLIPTTVPLYRAAAICAELLDPGGHRVEGRIHVSWDPIEPTTVRHGNALEVWVRQGRLRVTGLPPLHRRFTIRLGDSDVAIRRDWTLTEGDDCTEVGILRFEETRSLEGVVRFPDGSPASEAVVALVPSSKARRLPLVGGGVDEGLYSTRTDALGSFRLDGLPLDLRGDLALVAHAAGATDAVEDPVDLDAEEHHLRLDPECALSVDAGYGDGQARSSFGFWLEFLEDPADPESYTTLGEVEPGLPGGYDYAGIEPGQYRLRWALREPYAALPGSFRETRVSPGWASRLTLRLEGRRLRGRASLNREPLSRGWILLTGDPGIGGVTSVGRVIDGEYEMVDPPQDIVAYAAVIPEGKPQALQNLTRGEALPVRIEGYRAGLAARWLDVEYAAYDLTLLFGEGFLARYPGSTLGIDWYEWDRGRFRPFPGEELIEEPRISLRLLRPGSHRISVRSSRGSLLYSRLVVLRENLVLPVKD